MPRIEIELSEEMFRELVTAVGDEPFVTPTSWALDAVEAALATRRLPRVIPSTKAARMIEAMVDLSPSRAERRTVGPMRAAEIPSNFDLESLADIT